MATKKGNTKKNVETADPSSSQEDLNAMTYGEWGWSALGEDENTEESPASSPPNPDSGAIEDPGKNKINRLPSASMKNASDQKSGKTISGISSSPSFHELDQAIKMSMESQDSQGSLNSLSPNNSFSNHNKLSSTDLTTQKVNQQRLRQSHRQHLSNSNFQSRNNNQPNNQFNYFGTAVTAAAAAVASPPATPSVPARQELVNFINESESRAIILFHSALISPVDIRTACSKFGVLYYIRPEFHGKGVTLISYFDLRAATSAHGSICEDLGPDASASAHFSVMLHAANSNSEEFRLVVRQLPRGGPESEVESVFSRYGQLRSIQKTYGDADKAKADPTAAESSAYSIEYHNIQDARLAVSELSATSTQIWGAGVSIKFAPLDDRKQQLCRQLLATLSRWRTEMSSKSVSMGVHGQMSMNSPINIMQGPMGAPLVMGNGNHSPMSMSYHQMLSQQMPAYGVPAIPAMHYGMPALNYAGNIPMFDSNQQIVGGVGGQKGGSANANMHHHPGMQQSNSGSYPGSGSYGMVGMHNLQVQNQANMVPVPWGSVYAQQGHQSEQSKSVQGQHSNQKYGQHGSGPDAGNDKSNSNGNNSNGNNSNSSNNNNSNNSNSNNGRSTPASEQFSSQRNSRGPQGAQGTDAKFAQGQGGNHGGYQKGGSKNMSPPLAVQGVPGQQIPSTYALEQQFSNVSVGTGINAKVPHHHNGGHSTAANQFQQGIEPSMMPGMAPNASVHHPPHINSSSKGGRGSGKYNNAAHIGNNNNNNNNNNGNQGMNSGQGHKVNQIESGFALDLNRIGEDKETRTTIMVRNIPNKYNQQMLLEEVNVNHEGTYDFFYLPIDFKNRCNVGYCFINFLEPKHIPPFVYEFNGQRWKSFNSEKICAVSFARIQGKSAMISRFQNSSLLEKDDTYQPLLFYSSGPDVGKPEPFPSNVRHAAPSTSTGNSTSPPPARDSQRGRVDSREAVPNLHAGSTEGDGTLAGAGETYAAGSSKECSGANRPVTEGSAVVNIEG